MPNMSYCRFQNTLTDLQDCADVIGDVDDLSEEEASAREGLIRTCRQIVEYVGDEFADANDEEVG